MSARRCSTRCPTRYFTAILAARRARPPSPGRGVIDLGRGNPDLPPPPDALDAAAHADAETATPAVHGYPPFAGHARAARRDRRALRAPSTASTLDPDREVAVLPGTKTGIMLAALATAGPRRRRAAARSRLSRLPLGRRAGRRARGPRCRSTRRPATSPTSRRSPPRSATGARLLVLNYPSNPARCAPRPGTFEAAVAYAHRHGMWLLNDLAYGFLAFDGHRGAQRARRAGRARRGDRAVVAVEDLRHGGLADRLRGRRRRARSARIQTLLDHIHAGVFTALQRGLLAALRGDQDHVAAPPRGLPAAPRRARRHAARGGRRDRRARGDVLRVVAPARGADRRAPDRRAPRRRRARRGLRRARRRPRAAVARRARRRRGRGRAAPRARGRAAAR